MIHSKTLSLCFAILLFVTGCDALEQKQTIPLVPDTLVNRPAEFVYSDRVTSVLDRRDAVSRSVLAAKFLAIRSITEDALSPADAEKAMAWYQGYFTGNEWKNVSFQNGDAVQNMFVWQQGNKVFAVSVIKFDPKDFSPEFDRVFLQYHVQNLENQP